MIDWAAMVAPALTFAIAAGSPGPATLAVASTSMSHGRAAGLAIGLGLSLGLAFWGLVAAAGLAAAILTWAPALAALRIGGALFLLWLAWRAGRSAWRPAAAVAKPVRAHGSHFRMGLLLNLLNPKALLAWTVAIAIGLPDRAGIGTMAAIVALCAILGCLIYCAYALAFSRQSMMSAYARLRRWIDGVCAALFGVAALRLITWKGMT